MYYYFNDGKIFSSKIEAILHNIKTKKNFNFYYFDNVFSKLNWLVEPTQSLGSLYVEQAKRIRDQYDYVILCYSGGYDSTNILETFFYNNIKLDKIVVVGALNQDSHSGVDENHNGEIYHNVFPYLRQLGLESITQICDYSLLLDNPNNFSIYNYGENWTDSIGTRLSPHNWFWRDLEKHVIPKEYNNKKVAILFGKEKPHLFWIKDNTISYVPLPESKIGFAFNDEITNYGNIQNFENSDRINFYWDPNFPLILLKQLHVLKNLYYTTSEHYTNSWNNTDRSIAADFIQNYNWLNKKGVHNIIYNLRCNLRFKSPKSFHKHLSLRDSFFINKKDSESFKLYYAGVKYIYKNIGLGGQFHHLLNESVNSKIYFIES